MNWLTEFLDARPEYRRLPTRKAVNAIHFQIAPNQYEAHFWQTPRFERTARGLWIPRSGLTQAIKLAQALIRSPRALTQFVAMLPFAATIVLQPPDALQPDGFDTYLDSLNPVSNNGTATTWRVGTNGRYRSIGSFTLTSVPPGSVFSAVSLQLVNTAAGGTATAAYVISRILSGNSLWGETTATWNKQDGGGGHNWAGSAGCSTSGTDFSSTPMISVVPPNTLAAHTYTLLPSEFQQMFLANYGLVHFQTPATADDYRLYASSEHATPANHPQLTGTYTTPSTYRSLLGVGQ